ncbi:MAG TPA: SgcJ/EcaC family oxidoreductase [Edaphobacter sp.]|jgi:uncharacterized protein (TIGR02246 family)|nr:SgcJ/EcaC family oxidoreductase [Edaphobacter sp.]
MKCFIAFSTAILIGATLTGCNQSSGNIDSDIAAIKATETQWNQDWAARDVDRIMSHYAADAVLITPGGPAVNGKAAIAQGLKSMVADPATSLKFNPDRVEVSKSGDVAWTEGSYTLTMTDPQSKQIINDHGSYVTTYRRQPDGSWRAIVDIATSETPPSMPTAQTSPQPN